MEVLLKTVKKI